VPVLVRDLALLLVRLDEHARVADEVRIALGQDELHRFRVDEGDEPEHTLLLVWNTHVVHRPVDAANALPGKGRSESDRVVAIKCKKQSWYMVSMAWCMRCVPEVARDVLLAERAVGREGEVNLARSWVHHAGEVSAVDVRAAHKLVRLTAQHQRRSGRGSARAHMGKRLELWCDE
jgi:hypothetical protein